MSQITRLGLYGGPRPVYASFAGKSSGPMAGPFVAVAAETYAPGAAARETYSPGTIAAESYAPGAVKRETQPA